MLEWICERITESFRFALSLRSCPVGCRGSIGRHWRVLDCGGVEAIRIDGKLRILASGVAYWSSITGKAGTWLRRGNHRVAEGILSRWRHRHGPVSGSAWSVGRGILRDRAVTRRASRRHSRNSSIASSTARHRGDRSSSFSIVVTSNRRIVQVSYFGIHASCALALCGILMVPSSKEQSSNQSEKKTECSSNGNSSRL